MNWDLVSVKKAHSNKLSIQINSVCMPSEFTIYRESNPIKINKAFGNDARKDLLGIL